MISEIDKSITESSYGQYLSALVEGDSDRASLIVHQVFKLGWDLEILRKDIICAAQAALGDLWKQGDVSIAQEHIATEISMMQLNWIRSHATPRASLNLNVLVTVPYEEEHILPARVVADSFLMDGWQVHFPGLKTPADELIAYLSTKKIDLLAFSLTMKPRRTFYSLLEKIKKLPSPPFIIVGGQAAQSLEKIAEIDAFPAGGIQALKFNSRFLGPDGYEAGFSQLKNVLGRRIVALRQERQISQQRLAKEAQIDRAYLSALENGKQNPSMHVLYRVAAAAGVSIQDLVGS